MINSSIKLTKHPPYFGTQSDQRALTPLQVYFNPKTYLSEFSSHYPPYNSPHLINHT